ncbi:MAG: hypothetical protein ACRDGT_01065 [Candidatus Limnocylindria bacterium]
MVINGQPDGEVNIPSTTNAVVAEFEQRDKADGAVEALGRAGFKPEQVSFVARGAEHDGEKFIPGTLLVTVHPDGRNDDAERVLREQGAKEIRSGKISATGEVIEERAEEREEASSG